MKFNNETRDPQRFEVSPSKRDRFYRHQDTAISHLHQIRSGISEIITELERRKDDDQKPIDTRIFPQAEKYAADLVRLVNEIANRKIEGE